MLKHKVIGLVVENQNFQWFFSGALGKQQKLRNAITVKVCHLHRLLIFAGKRRAVFQIRHNTVNGVLKIIVLL